VAFDLDTRCFGPSTRYRGQCIGLEPYSPSPVELLNPFDAQACHQKSVPESEQCDAFRTLLVEAVLRRLLMAYYVVYLSADLIPPRL